MFSYGLIGPTRQLFTYQKVNGMLLVNTFSINRIFFPKSTGNGLLLSYRQHYFLYDHLLLHRLITNTRELIWGFVLPGPARDPTLTFDSTSTKCVSLQHKFLHPHVQSKLHVHVFHIVNRCNCYAPCGSLFGQ
jgi:hypothetical protein